MTTLYHYSKNHIVVVWILLYCLWSASLGAQTQPEPQIKDNWILKSDESDETKKYIARDAIVLKAEGNNKFRFSAEEHSQSFSAKIDPGLLFPPIENYKIPNLGVFDIPNPIIHNKPVSAGVVGTILGGSSISPMGSANYTIPIDLPLGINNMQPSLSVNYNSQGGNGALGLCWDINGISSISRSTQNFYYDEINGTVESNSIKFNNYDRVSLDGRRLILINSTFASSI